MYRQVISLRVDYRDLGMRIRKKREEAGLSQADLAAGAKLSTQHISNVENAKSKIGLEKLVMVANVLGTSLDELICGSIKNSRPIYQSDVADMIAEFSDVEMRVLPEYLRCFDSAYHLLESSVRGEEDEEQ